MKPRLIMVAGSVFFLFSLLIARYFLLQIVEHDYWTAKASMQHEVIVKEPFKRGTFYADLSLQPGFENQFVPLVIDINKYHLFIDPLVIPKRCRATIIEHLQTLTGLTEASEKEFEKASRSRCLKRFLSIDEKKAILAWWQPYARKNKMASNALFFVLDYQRMYPYGTMLGQTLHTIQELKEDGTDQAQPTGGLESFFNEWLKGMPGKRKLKRSPRHHLETDTVIQSPEMGADVYLTINPTIQAIAEREIEKGVKQAQAKGGWCIVMDADTGYIVALAQYPFFDPPRYKQFFNDPDLIQQSKVHAVTDAFELGSIMKPITLAIALNANKTLQEQQRPTIFEPNDKLPVTRTLFPGRMSKPLKDLQSCKFLSMPMALQRSSNIYMAELADRVVKDLGADWYREQLVNVFGFENKTGIELPAESPGLVPSRQRYHSNGAPEWSVPTPYSLSIGYNLLASGLQMIRAYALFANGGYLVTPTLVKKVIKNDQLILDHTQPAKRAVLDPEIAYKILQTMKFTTQEGGTGRLAAVPGYTEAGKTGSAEKLINGQYASKVHISSFIGVMPANAQAKTKLVALVSIDEPAPILNENGKKGYLGGQCAAPIFREVMRHSAQVLAIEPDDPFGYSPSDPRYNPDCADWAKEVKALKQQFEQWNLR
jgi:cell division protein FtsI (penicillin-binding protein 3)